MNRVFFIGAFMITSSFNFKYDSSGLDFKIGIDIQPRRIMNESQHSENKEEYSDYEVLES